MFERPKEFLSRMLTVLGVIGFLVGIVGYGTTQEILHDFAIALPFIGALAGTVLAYVLFGLICAFVFLTNKIEEIGGPKAYIQKKWAVSLVFLAMLGFFIYVCVQEYQGILTYFSAMSFNIFLLIINPCVYPVTAILGTAPYVGDVELVRAFYITLVAFVVFVILLYLYSEWTVGSFNKTAYDVVTVDAETGNEVDRKSVSYGEVSIWLNILEISILAFTILTWPPIAILVILIRMLGWDYLC